MPIVTVTGSLSWRWRRVRLACRDVEEKSKQAQIRTQRPEPREL